MSNIGLIISREFNERVRKKSFIISTILVPLLMVVLMAAPALIMQFAKGETKQIVVVDDSGLISDRLESDEELQFSYSNQSVEQLRRDTVERFGVLHIGADILSNPKNVKLYTSESSNMSIESNISGQLEDIIEEEKLKGYNIENLASILDEVRTNVSIQTFRNVEAEEGSEDEPEAQSNSSLVASGMGWALGFVLYMFILIYGAMVMQSVIDEKSSRVLEVMVSSVRPFDLMMGKILGVASVAITQILIWAVLIGVVGSVVVSTLMPEDIMASAQGLQQGVELSQLPSDLNPEMLQAVATLTDVGFIVKIFSLLVVFLCGGYLLYSALFAAIGAAADNIQDTQQLQMPVTIPIILSLMIMMFVVKDPNSSIAFWFSMIPLTSPIVMMARIPYDIPMWEVALSLTILYGSFVGFVWFAAKIYRVGIFMYGKKPSFKELYKWMKYKY